MQARVCIKKLDVSEQDSRGQGVVIDWGVSQSIGERETCQGGLVIASIPHARMHAGTQ